MVVMVAVVGVVVLLTIRACSYRIFPSFYTSL